MAYAGWRGVTDPKHVIIAVTFCPVADDLGFLAVLFRGGATACHENVPLRKYEAIIKVPYALAYYHKQIKMQYPRVGDPVIPPYESTEDGVQRKQEQQAKERLASVTLARPVTLNLFGSVETTGKKRSGKNSTR